MGYMCMKEGVPVMNQTRWGSVEIREGMRKVGALVAVEGELGMRCSDAAE